VEPLEAKRITTPPSLKSAANCLIAIGFFYVLIIGFAFGMSERAPDTIGKVFGVCVLGLGLLLWTAAFFLYRRSKIGKYIWWVCCPLVMLQVPVGTLLGIFAIVYLNKPESKAALAGQPLPPAPGTPKA
jgi:hypothetical protein